MEFSRASNISSPPGSPILNDSQISVSLNRSNGSETLASRPSVQTAIKDSLLLGRVEAREIQTFSRHSPPEYQVACLEGMPSVKEEKLDATEDEFEKKGSSGNNEAMVDCNTYPSFIHPSFRENAYIDLLFSGMESYFSENKINLLCKKFTENLEICFNKIRSNFLKNKQPQLDFLEKECQAFSAKSRSGSVSVNETEAPEKSLKVFDGYGGSPGNAYFIEYSRGVAVPTLSEFLKAVISAYRGSSESLIKDLIEECLPNILMSKAGEMRGDIAYKNGSEGFSDRSRVSYGKLADSTLYDPVHHYPGWRDLIFPQVKKM